MHRVSILLLVLLVPACNTQPLTPASPDYQIPSGSKLILKQELVIPPNAGRVYIQYGKVVTPTQKDNWHAHCWFLSWDVLEHAQVIKPDTFIITRSQQLEDSVMRDTNLQYAMNGFQSSDMGVPTALIYTTEMRIHSDSQSAIRRFACSHWENPLDAIHLTVAKMQQTLGDIAEIQINNMEHK